jgi:exonuclease III
MGGDWNMTVCTDNNNQNIDILNMLSPPSIVRYRQLANYCEDYKLTDPYRALQPDRRDYTYIPRTGKKTGHVLIFLLYQIL